MMSLKWIIVYTIRIKCKIFQLKKIKMKKKKFKNKKKFLRNKKLEPKLIWKKKKNK